MLRRGDPGAHQGDDAAVVACRLPRSRPAEIPARARYVCAAKRSWASGVTPGPEFVTTNATSRGARSRLDDDLAPLAVPEETDRHARAASRNGLGGTRAHRPPAPRSQLPASALFEPPTPRLSNDATAMPVVEQVPVNGREEDVVVAIRLVPSPGCIRERYDYAPPSAGLPQRAQRAPTSPFGTMSSCVAGVLGHGG